MDLNQFSRFYLLKLLMKNLNYVEISFSEMLHTAKNHTSQM